MASQPFGIDWLSLSHWVSSVTVPSFSKDPVPWTHVVPQKGSDGLTRRVYWHTGIPVGHGTVNVKVMEGVPGHNPAPYRVELKWNPSRQMFGKTGRLLDPSQVSEAVLDVVEAVAPWVILGDVWRAKVTRLDLTRDFIGVESTPLLLGLLASTAHRCIRGEISGDVQTLYWNGPGSCHVSAYDKSVERGDDIGGWLRTEVRVCRPWLAKGGITTLASIGTDVTGALGSQHWRASGLGQTMQTDERAIVRALLHRDDLSDREIIMFLGWLVARDIPGAELKLSSATLAKYRRVEKSLGGCDLSSRLGYSVRLDLESGTVVKELLAS